MKKYRITFADVREQHFINANFDSRKEAGRALMKYINNHNEDLDDDDDDYLTPFDFKLEEVEVTDVNENINLVEILKDCPKGTKLYSPIYGEVEFLKIKDIDDGYPIVVMTDENVSACFNATGKFDRHYHNAECLLFPSKDQRDWTKFKCPKPKFNPKTLQPCEKVIGRDKEGKWHCDNFSHIL